MTFYFYDLETSGFNPREARIMQFAGQRTDMELKPIGKPHNMLIKLTEDILPDPDAILVTGITPQQTLADGVTEAEFLKLFTKEIAMSGTIFVGFNSIRFDDEFMRFLQWRNFYDPYEWQWKNKRSRWDLLDVVRMTRALRPEGIAWPFDSNGAPANRLELLANVNKLTHGKAHDALSDVEASIDLARLIKSKQPKLFQFLLDMRNKKQIEALVISGQPFVYSSGKYPSEFEKTTVAIMVGKHPNSKDILVYDLRHDPDEYAQLSANKLVEAWRRRWDETGLHLPVKTLKLNRCPAVAPLSVLDKASQKRLGIDLEQIEANHKKLHIIRQWPKRLHEALAIMDHQKQAMFVDESNVDVQLYDGFVDDTDRHVLPRIQSAQADELTGFASKLQDDRLKKLLPLYKARNFPRQLTDRERDTWEAFRQQRLMSGGESSRSHIYFKRLEELSQLPALTGEQRYLLEELQLYGQSILPGFE